MGNSVKTRTQGISDDWLSADGDYTTKLRGDLDETQIESALKYLAVLDTPDGDDLCAPHVLVESPSGQIGFIGQGDSVFCLESETEVSPQAGAAFAVGRIGLADLAEPDVITAPPPPATAPPPPSRRAKPKARKSGQQPAKPDPRDAKPSRVAGILGTAVGTALSGGVASGVEAGIGEAFSRDDASDKTGQPERAVGRVRKRLTWRQYVSFLFGGGFIVGGLVCVAGAISVADRGGSSEDIAFAAILAGAFTLIGVIWIFASLRAAPRFDQKGNRVDASGNVLLGIGMAHAMNMADDWSDDFSDGGFD